MSLLLIFWCLFLGTFIQNSECQQIVRTPVRDNEITALGEKLWRLESNNFASQISVDLQNTASRNGVDNAPRPLFRIPASVYNNPIVSKLVPLYDNYVPETNVSEVVTPAETREETAFLDAILATPVMKEAEKFLTTKRFIINRRVGQNGRVQVNRNAFRNAIRKIWFGIFSRERNVDASSGFEHVFLGERRDGKVIGLHNWIYYANQEKQHNVNYLGHMRVVRLGNKGMVVKNKFNWNGVPKPVSTMFVGTSPEFEMALYTVCYYAKPGGKCPITLGGKSVPISTYYVNRRRNRFLSSAFPDV